MATAGDELGLWALFVGGRHQQATIELHDVQFVVARSLEEAGPLIRARWWGVESSAHLDAYAKLDEVDGSKIRPRPIAECAASAVSLYFVNVGGYLPNVFGELHFYSFHVGSDKKQVWRVARAKPEFGQLHQDDFNIVDDVICVDEHLLEQRYGLMLEVSSGPRREPEIVRNI